MTTNRWTGVLLATAGIIACGLGVGGFVWTVSTNNLPWSPAQSARQFYQEIGNAYSQGFVMGFFLCFFLVLLAVTIATWWRNRQAAETAEPSARHGAGTRAASIERG